MTRRRRFFSVEDGFTVLDLVQSAVDHLLSARALFQWNPRGLDSAGYLSHLALELLYKALLLEKTQAFPGEHSLLTLHSQLAETGLVVQLGEAGVAVLRDLDQFKELRYPKPDDPVSIGTEDWGRIATAANSLLVQVPKDVHQRLTAKANEPVVKGGRVLMRKKIDP